MRPSFTLQQVLLGLFLLLLVVAELFLVSRLEVNPYFLIFFDVILMGIGYWTLKIWLPSWEKGADGEAIVQEELKKLDSKYLQIADFHKGKKGNVDFVVVGPTGIYTIEVKSTKRGILSLENDSLYFDHAPFKGTDPLSQAYAEAMSVQRFLQQSLNQSYTVTPILVFANPKMEIQFGKQKQRGVYVVGASWLNNIIAGQYLDYQFTAEVCAKIRDILHTYSSDIV